MNDPDRYAREIRAAKALEPKGTGYLIGAVIQAAFGGLVVIRWCVSATADSSAPDTSYTAGSFIGLLFGVLFLALGVRAVRRYLRSSH